MVAPPPGKFNVIDIPSPGRLLAKKVDTQARPLTLLVVWLGWGGKMSKSGGGMKLYPAHAMIRNFVGFMIRKLSVTSSQ